MKRKAYIVTYIRFKKKKHAEAGILSDKNSECDYEVFNEGLTKENKKAAEERFNEMTNDIMYYSVSLTKVLASTDY